MNKLYRFKLHFYFTLFSIICQEKLFDKIRQITTDAIIPVKSAIKAANNTNLVFFIFTELLLSNKILDNYLTHIS